MMVAENTEATPPDLTSRRAVLILHGLLSLLATYVLLSAYAISRSPNSLFTLTALVLLHASLYRLPAGFSTRPNFQRLVVVLGVGATALWLLVFFTEGQIGYFAAVAAVLLVPLVRQRLNVWVTTVAGLLVFGLMATPLGWTPSGVAMRATETFLLIAGLLVWAVFALLLEHVRADTERSTSLSHEKRKVLVMTQVAKGLAAAEDVETVFSVVNSALRELVGGRQCRLDRIDPIRWIGDVVAVEDDADETPGDAVKLDDGTPLRRTLEKGKPVFVDSAAITIQLDTGPGILYVVTCQAEQDLLDPSTVGLLESLAEATATTMRNVEVFGETKERAQTDSLTGLPNRGSFQIMIKQEFARAKRHGRPMSLLMVDLDFLKNINDRFGHPMGDMAIREVAERIMAVSRGSDYLAARYGGEEFCVILPETDFEGAFQAGQRICDRIAGTPLPTVGQITASVGVATYPLNAITKDELIQAADEALYKAKRGGRNQVAASEPAALEGLPHTAETADQVENDPSHV